MDDERRLSDGDVDRIANAVAARLRDEDSDPSVQSGASKRTADARRGSNRRLPPSQRREESAQRDRSRSEQVKQAGGRVRDDVASTRTRDDARGIERLDEHRAAGGTGRDTPGAPSAEGTDAGVTFESTLEEDLRVSIPAEITAELDVEPGASLRLTVHRVE